MSAIKIGLVGNCQSSDVGNLLRRSRSVRVTAIADVNARGSAEYADAIFNIRNKNDIDYLISQPIGDSFEEISSETLRKIYIGTYLTYTNVYFNGLHPDILYVGKFGERLASPLGDYNSRIVFACFVNGLTTEQCRLRFNARAYEQLGYFHAFEQSLSELDRRDQENDIRFSGIFRTMTRTTRTMLSVNHPTPATTVALCRCITAYFGDDGSELSADIFGSDLSEGPVWPIYPEIAACHDLPYQTPMFFYPNLRSGIGPMTLPEFIGQSYAMYERYGREKIAAFDAGIQVQGLDLPES